MECITKLTLKCIIACLFLVIGISCGMFLIALLFSFVTMDFIILSDFYDFYINHLFFNSIIQRIVIALALTLALLDK